MQLLEDPEIQKAFESNIWVVKNRKRETEIKDQIHAMASDIGSDAEDLIFQYAAGAADR